MAAAVRPAAARPVLSASLAVFAGFFGAVASNAFYAQAGRHTNPLLTTRPAGGSAAADAPADDGNASLPVPLVAEVQSALQAAGYYAAIVDGRPGKVTSAAIRAFQGDNGLAVDGEASPKLLGALRRVAEARDETDGKARRIASLDPPASETTDDAGTGNATAAARRPDRELVRRIQAGLTAAKVAELQADGIMGSRTEAAIRAFQASQGLDVTGQPEERILKRLKALGAPKP